MRVRDNFKEDKNEELKEKIRVTILVAALTITPAAIVHKIDTDKMNVMREYYEVLLQNETEKAYLAGYIDGLFGIEDNFITPVVEECKDLVVEIPKEKTLVLAKKNIKY